MSNGSDIRRASTFNRTGIVRRWLKVAALSCALLMATMATSFHVAASPAATEAAGQVVKLRGAATLVRNKVAVPVALGILVQPGDQISTDPDSRLKIHYRDGSTTTMGEESTLTISTFEFNAETGNRDATLWLNSGIIKVITASHPNAGQSRFVLHTDYGFAATRGTEWIVIAGPNSSDICVLKGQVSVGLEAAVRRASMTVGAGMWVPVDKTSGISKTLAIPGDVLGDMLAATEELGDEVPYDPASAAPVVLPPPTPAAEPAPKKAPTKKFNFYGRVGGSY